MKMLTLNIIWKKLVLFRKKRPINSNLSPSLPLSLSLSHSCSNVAWENNGSDRKRYRIRRITKQRSIRGTLSGLPFLHLPRRRLSRRRPSPPQGTHFAFQQTGAPFPTRRPVFAPGIR